MNKSLKPFWYYYGSKYRAAPRYPSPLHETIIEPFAGGAGYSLRYPERKVILVEKYPVVAEIWRYLIGVSESEIRQIPIGVTHVDDLPAWVPVPAKHLVGWWFNHASTSPKKALSAGRKRGGGKFNGWTEGARERVASQVRKIRHWQIIEGDYTSAPDIHATWFIDPPYNNSAGAYYVEKAIDYTALGSWCLTRRGQVTVCENEGANWLPFTHLATLPSMNGRRSAEVIWYRES